MATRTAIEKLTLSSGPAFPGLSSSRSIVGVSGWIVGDTPGQMTKLLICNMEAEMFRKARKPGKDLEKS